MREILFRAWDPKHKFMLEDFNQENYKKYCELIGKKDIIGDNIHLMVWSVGIHYQTLVQWTGLVDCKGNKIFEGDVVYISGWGNYLVEDIGKSHDDLVSAIVEQDMGEVLGNRFQNPELIKE